MKLDTVLSIHHLILQGSKNIDSRNESISMRKNSLFTPSLVKLAFDTRRINQETDYNPRRGLQNYHRSEPFISQAIDYKLTAFKKLSILLDNLKSEYEKNPEWQDSYTRVLASAIHKGLRTAEQDQDFSDSQPSMASLDYLEELLYVRYRLTPDNLISMSEVDLRNAILSKDELLIRNGASYIKPEIKPSDISKLSYEQMFDKMLAVMAQVMTSKSNSNDWNQLFDVRATKDNPEVDRTITIQIKDKFADPMAKTGDTVAPSIQVKSEIKQDNLIVVE